MSNISQPNSITRPPVLPLFWFTDERIRFATERPGEIPTKKHTPLDDQSADKIFLVHIPKLSAAWGDDESVDGISVHTWVQASENFGKAIDRLSAAPDAANPHSYGVEFAKRRSFFLNLNDFADWCQIEKKLHNELFNGTAFDVSYWTGQVSGVVNAVKAARMVHSAAPPLAPNNISGLLAKIRPVPFGTPPFVRGSGITVGSPANNFSVALPPVLSAQKSIPPRNTLAIRPISRTGNLVSQCMMERKPTAHLTGPQVLMYQLQPRAPLRQQQAPWRGTSHLQPLRKGPSCPPRQPTMPSIPRRLLHPLTNLLMTNFLAYIY
ncbi:hypothetical protein R3P38DRAFT_2770907 [Favolaschia claudopus]|uniref:Uncharacterized protein n=1 Tax=Favolaschia claudopus TaxID=2862362 RepID=A0AAW0CCS9_9AGAR